MLAGSGEGGLLSFWSADNGRPGERVGLPHQPVNAIKFLNDERVAIATDSGCFIWAARAEWKLERIIGSNSDSSPFLGRVEALHFSPDGKLLATGGGVPSRLGEVKIWNVADGSLAREFKDAHSDTVYGVAFTSDGKRLASCGADKFIRIFELETGKLIKTFEGHTHHVLAVSWKRDGRILASAGADKTVKIWDMITGEQKKNVENFKKEVTAVRYLLGQGTILVAGADNNLRIIKEDGGDVRAFGGGKGFQQSAAVSADGRVVISGGDDSVLRVYDSNDGKALNSFEAPK
jgi:WD40 repeat protein